jgi:hypothetical protein
LLSIAPAWGEAQAWVGWATCMAGGTAHEHTGWRNQAQTPSAWQEWVGVGVRCDHGC